MENFWICVLDLVCKAWDWIKSLDLKEVTYAAIGAACGFGMTLALDRHLNKVKQLKRKLNLLRNLYLELKDILDTLKDSTINETVFIDFPVYQAVVQSGAILDFVEDDFYFDLMRTYLEIKILKEKEADNGVDGNAISENRDAVIKITESLIPRMMDDIKYLEKKTKSKLKRNKNA